MGGSNFGEGSRVAVNTCGCGPLEEKGFVGVSHDSVLHAAWAEMFRINEIDYILLHLAWLKSSDELNKAFDQNSGISALTIIENLMKSKD